jgi:hypothetical protein
MWGSWRLGLGVLLAMAACNTTPAEGPTDTRAREPGAQATEKVAAQRSTRKFDPKGRLLPSDEYVAGIRLPRGCELFRREELQHVYRIRAPIESVLAYFGPMMITGNVERRGEGAVYKRASVRGAEVNPTKVDVAILEVGSNLTRISITELPPPPEHPPTADETRAAARDSFRMLD